MAASYSDAKSPERVQMSLVAIGINHKTATVDLREKVAFAPDKIHEAMRSLAKETQSGEAVIVSTCNRTELYCNTENAEQVVRWLEDYHGLSHEEVALASTNTVVNPRCNT